MTKTIKDILNAVPEEIPQGKRWEILFNLVLNLYLLDVEPVNLYPILQSINASCCKPPHTQKFIDHIVKNAIQFVDKDKWNGEYLIATPPNPANIGNSQRRNKNLRYKANLRKRRLFEAEK